MISDKTHPIETKWIIKNVLLWSPLATLGIVGELSKKIDKFPVLILLYITITPFLAMAFYIYLILFRRNFHYEFGQKFMILHQGILAKSERTVPYGRIQNVIISQGLINKLIGLASVEIETASIGVDTPARHKASREIRLSSKMIWLPGLLYRNALEVRNMVMELMKQNPIDDAQSGL